MPDAPLVPSAHATARKLAPFSKGDCLVIALLIVLPLAIYGGPALFGHLYVPGDDLNQNLPLRVLSGEFIRAGQVPSWNPLIWTGTPLLGGWNAGSYFPGTFLFAFLPLSLAWVVNLACAPALAGIGIYLLLRRFGTGALAGALGALIFSYTGFMAGQIVHLGLDQGTAFTPWILLALDVFLRPDRSPRLATNEVSPSSTANGARGVRPWLRIELSAVVWVVILAISVGCTVLAGDPRAISTGTIAALIYLIALLFRKDARRVGGLACVLVAGAIGALFSAAQLLPGLSFLHASQRGTTALAFFGTGSVSPREILAHMLLPFSLGGNGTLGLPVYDGGYNLPELTFGAGFIALVALGAYVPEALASLGTRFRRWRPVASRDAEHDPRRQLGVWFSFVIIGAILTLGTNWGPGRLLVHVPFFGNERLQNRNALLMDLALAVLAGLFCDEMLAAIGHRSLKSLRLRRPIAIATSLVPIGVAIAGVVFELIAPVRFQRYLYAVSINRSLNVRLLGYLIPTLVIALAIGIFVVFANRLDRRLARIALVVLVLADVGLYIANASYATAPASLFHSQTALSTRVRHLLGAQGRFALYDPFYAITAPNPAIVDAVGLPDINALQGNPSIQGYGSLVNGVYQRVTGSHLLNSLNPRILAGESVNTLDLRVLLTPPNYLENQLSSRAAIPMPSNLDHLAAGVPHMTTGPWTDDPGESTTWQLPVPQRLRLGTFVINPATLSTDPIDVELLDGSRIVEHASLKPSRNRVRVRFDPTIAATTLVLKNSSGTPVNIIAVAITTANPNERYVLNGMLQGYLPASHWTYDGTVGPLSALKNTQIHGLAWLQAVTTHTPNTHAATSGTVSVTRGAVTAPQVMRVHTTSPAILVRSEAYSTGWSVDVSPIGGGAHFHQVVHRFGLIQEVTLPAGNWVVTWHYRPVTVTIGIVLSLLGFGILVLVSVGLIVVTRRRRSRSRGTSPRMATATPGPDARPEELPISG